MASPSAAIEPALRQRRVFCQTWRAFGGHSLPGHVRVCRDRVASHFWGCGADSDLGAHTEGSGTQSEPESKTRLKGKRSVVTTVQGMCACAGTALRPRRSTRPSLSLRRLPPTRPRQAPAAPQSARHAPPRPCQPSPPSLQSPCATQNPHHGTTISSFVCPNGAPSYSQPSLFRPIGRHPPLNPPHLPSPLSPVFHATNVRGRKAFQYNTHQLRFALPSGLSCVLQR